MACLRLSLGRSLCALAVFSLVAAGCGAEDRPGANAELGLRRQQIGGLELTVVPTRLDAGGAAFTVTFDTHTGAPTIDVAASSTLTVNETPWTGAAWSGSGPDGHHRTGTLRFDPAGPATGTARLTIGGLDAPVAMTWQLDA